MIESIQSLKEMISALNTQSSQIQADLKHIGVGSLSPRNIATIRHAREFCFDAKKIVLPALQSLASKQEDSRALKQCTDLRKSVDIIDKLSLRKGRDIDLADGMLAPFPDLYSDSN